MNVECTNSLEKELKDILLQNTILSYVLERTRALKLPNWYLGAGAITQTVWNHNNGFDLNNGIEDYDLVYFDLDLSKEKEDSYLNQAKLLFTELSVDIVNEARVHLWYKQRYGKDIQPYTSTESAIDTWPTTATSVGITMNEEGIIKIYAPFGLEDLLSYTVRPNKTLITEDIYKKKVAKWTSIWPNLNVIAW